MFRRSHQNLGRPGVILQRVTVLQHQPRTETEIVQFLFRVLTPMLFFFSVIIYIGDFRIASAVLAGCGVLSHLIAEELKARS